MIRLGLCCKFDAEPIRFRTTTARALTRLDRTAALNKLSGLCRDNAESLLQALQYCAGHGIGCFRINSQILPLRTHPEAGYQVAELPDSAQIVSAFRACGDFARAQDIRTTFHPDPFVLLASPRETVTRNSIDELAYQTEVADWVQADVINIHVGGAYGNKAEALDRLRRVLGGLPDAIRTRLTLENDERSYSPRELLPFCRAEQIPMVYDVHHHRCLPDGLSIAQVTKQAIATWNREPLFHISSPREGWSGRSPNRHADMIHPMDVPRFWMDLAVTVEVEAKAKERAIAHLARILDSQSAIPSRNDTTTGTNPAVPKRRRSS